MEEKGEVDEIDIGTTVKSSYIRNPRSSNFLFFDLTYTIYWCKIFKWAVSDSGSTGALQALGKSSILLRSTILN